MMDQPSLLSLLVLAVECTVSFAGECCEFKHHETEYCDDYCCGNYWRLYCCREKTQQAPLIYRVPSCGAQQWADLHYWVIIVVILALIVAVTVGIFIMLCICRRNQATLRRANMQGATNVATAPPPSDESLSYHGPSPHTVPDKPPDYESLPPPAYMDKPSEQPPPYSTNYI